MMPATRCCLIYGGLLTIPTVTFVLSVYVQTGSDITDCSMKCQDKKSVLQLYQECGGVEKSLLEVWCDNMWQSNNSDPRFSYNTSSGCWGLADARKNDSCRYYTMRHVNGTTLRSYTDITVLDPSTPAPPPSPQTLPHPAALAVAAALAVGLLSVGIFLCCKRCKKRRNVPSDDEEMKQRNDHLEENGHHPRADDSDPPGVTRKLLNSRGSGIFAA